MDNIRVLSVEEMALVCGGTWMDTIEARDPYGGGEPPDPYDGNPDGPDWDDPWDQPDYDNGGDTGGGGDSDTAVSLTTLTTTFLQLIEAYKTGHVASSAIFTALNYGNLSADTALLTMEWAIKDIETYRATDGLHVGNPIGSLVPWQQLQIDWSQFDQGGDPEEVLANYLDSLD